jgi:hypothetical protein
MRVPLAITSSCSLCVEALRHVIQTGVCGRVAVMCCQKLEQFAGALRAPASVRNHTPEASHSGGRRVCHRVACS